MPLPLLALLAALAAAPSAPPSGAEPCTTRLKAAEAARDLAQVKLADENERADAQAYLIRLELRVTKERLAAALAKCGAPCAAPTRPGG